MNTKIIFLVGLLCLSVELLAQTKNPAVVSPRTHFNQHHPELKNDERFLGNITTDSYQYKGDTYFSLEEIDFMTTQINFSKIPYSTKRLGDTAYTDFGVRIPNGLPVFISEKEYQLWQNDTRVTRALIDSLLNEIKKKIHEERLRKLTRSI